MIEFLGRSELAAGWFPAGDVYETEYEEGEYYWGMTDRVTLVAVRTSGAMTTYTILLLCQSVYSSGALRYQCSKEGMSVPVPLRRLVSWWCVANQGVIIRELRYVRRTRIQCGTRRNGMKSMPAYKVDHFEFMVLSRLSASKGSAIFHLTNRKRW